VNNKHPIRYFLFGLMVTLPSMLTAATTVTEGSHGESFVLANYYDGTPGPIQSIRLPVFSEGIVIILTLLVLVVSIIAIFRRRGIVPEK